jgi:hypothetical protein
MTSRLDEEIRRYRERFGEWPPSDDGAWLIELLDESRKKVADADAERIVLESALVDAMGALQFYESSACWYPKPEDTVDAGKRARVTLRRLFDWLAGFSRIQKLKE